MAEKHEIYFATDADGNASVGFGIEEVVEAIGEYRSPPARVVCLQIDMDVPAHDTDEDAVTVVAVVVPPEGEEDDGEKAPPELPAETPAQPEPAPSVAA